MRRDGARELGVMGGSFNMEDTRVSTIVSDTEPTLKNKREGEAWREENKTAEKKEKKNGLSRYSRRNFPLSTLKIMDMLDSNGLLSLSISIKIIDRS